MLADSDGEGERDADGLTLADWETEALVELDGDKLVLGLTEAD